MFLRRPRGHLFTSKNALNQPPLPYVCTVSPGALDPIAVVADNAHYAVNHLYISETPIHIVQPNHGRTSF